MLESLCEDTRFTQYDLPCYIIGSQVTKVIIVVEREDISRLIYTAMITVEDSYLFVREEGDIEDTILILLVILRYEGSRISKIRT